MIDLSSLNLNSPTIDPETGYVFVTGIAARVGVQDYTVEHGCHVYRDEAFVKELTESLRGKPVTRGHFEQKTDVNKDKKVGLIVSSDFDDSTGLGIVRVCIDDADLCNKIKLAIENNLDMHLGLSVGYSAALIDNAGSWEDSNGIAGPENLIHPYTKQQVLPVRTNHLAIVPMGRGGEVVKAVLDSISIETNETSCKDFYDAFLIIDNKSRTENNQMLSEHSDGGILYPYPEHHASANKKKKGTKVKIMEQEMLDKFSNTCDKMAKVCDSLTGMADKMTSSCDKMASYSDALTGAINYLEAIKNAYENQDRKVIGEYAQPTQEMIADAASTTKAVEEAVSLWVEFGDELKKKFESFDVTASDMKKALLSDFIEIEDGADVNTAFAMYRKLRENAAATAPKQGAVQKVFESYRDAAPTDTLPDGVTRRRDGGLSFGI